MIICIYIYIFCNWVSDENGQLIAFWQVTTWPFQLHFRDSKWSFSCWDIHSLRRRFVIHSHPVVICVLVCLGSSQVLLRLRSLLAVFFRARKCWDSLICDWPAGGPACCYRPGRRCHADGHDEGGVDSYHVTPRWRLRAGSGFLWSHRVY